MTSLFVLVVLVLIVTINVSIAFSLTRSMQSRVHPLKFLKMNQIDTSEWDLSLQSPSKINLFLRILRRRPDRYHDLASLFQAISLSDYMYFKKIDDKTATKDILTCSDVTLTVDENNLVLKALNLMRNRTNVKQYFKVHLEKIVPIQAGLGGGSGNAATAMYAFNKLCGYPGSLSDLRLWSGDIGSDITFFFTSGTAYCTGRGEIVNSNSKLAQADETIVHIFKPREGLSTPLVFKTLDLTKTSTENPDNLLELYVKNGALKAAESGYLINDLESPSFQCEPVLSAIKNEILKQNDSISGCMMSGSGTSIYALERKTQNSVLNFNPTLVLSKYPEVRHFQCRFLNKEDDKESWYD